MLLSEPEHDNNTQQWLSVSCETTKTVMKVNFRAFLKKKERKWKVFSNARFLTLTHCNVWFYIKEILQKTRTCPFIFQFQKPWNIGERINNADAFLLCARAFVPSGLWLKSPTALGSKHYYMALCLGFSSLMGIWGPTSETDMIWEPRMVQGSPLKINRQTVLHRSRLFISASLWAGPSSERASTQSPTNKARFAPTRQKETWNCVLCFSLWLCGPNISQNTQNCVIEEQVGFCQLWFVARFNTIGALS